MSCRLLRQRSDILLLDEATNHRDAERVAWLEHHLQHYAGTVIAVTHDRWFFDRMATHLLVFEGNSQVTFLAATGANMKAIAKNAWARMPACRNGKSIAS